MSSHLDTGLQHHSYNLATAVVIEGGRRILNLNPEVYPGGIAIWGALPAVLNTSAYPDEYNGVHVQARLSVEGPKHIDETFDIVRVHSQSVDGGTRVFEINGEDAASYNISTIFSKSLKYLICPVCGKLHSDRGIDAVAYHIIHECEHCGETFADSEPSISNAIMLLKETCQDAHQFRSIADPVDRQLDVKHNSFKAGMQIWGSNPAVLWTSTKLEEGGIHFHGFQPTQADPTVDNTYGSLTIYGILLDPEMTRYLMAQNALPHLSGLVRSLTCTECGREHFDKLDSATKPHLVHECEFCSSTFASPDNQACVSNPLVAVLESLK